MSEFSLSMEYIKNSFFNGQSPILFDCITAKSVHSFHKKIHGYQPTPLVSLETLAKKLGLSNILVKDEAHRFKLNSFKVLGGLYAIGQCICKKLGIPITEFNFKILQGREPITFATATDGNHGCGIAWIAQQVKQNAVVYMPNGASFERVENIRCLGAKCIVTDLNYDDTVIFANKKAKENGWLIIQDTAWEGYSEIPTWIMQGYMSMAKESTEQMNKLGISKPTHVLLQAGVGAMAGSVMGYFANRYGAENFKGIVVEPHQADCIYQSGKNLEGISTNVTGNLDTIMAGLACGVPNPLGWEILRNCSSYFMSVEDHTAALGMRIMGNPLAGDDRIISGESAAVGIGVLYAIAQHPNARQIMRFFNLNHNSIVLLFNTEGNTAPSNYLDIVWEGKYGI